MLLAIEIDNSVINFGLFDYCDECELINHFKIATDIQKTSDEYAVTVAGILGFHKIECSDITAAVISSVVPQLTDVISTMIKCLADVEAVVVGKGIKTGFPIKIDNPSELGADLVANAAAVVDMKKREHKNKTPCLIIDMGTATTIFAINSNGEYIGGIILAGIGMSLEALHGRTALLPTVSLAIPSKVIGKNSYDSVRSGIILGNSMMIDGFIKKFSDEMKHDGDIEVFITGEYAEAVMTSCAHSMRYIPNLTLKGLYCIYKNNFRD